MLQVAETSPSPGRKASLNFDGSLTIGDCGNNQELTFDTCAFIGNPKISLNISSVSNSQMLQVAETSFVELSSGSENSVEKQEWWIKDLNLTINDKSLLANKGEWLNDTIINAASKLLKKQFPNILGFQDCLLIPMKCPTNKFWIYHEKFKFNHVPSGVQIHYTGQNHWLTSIKLPNQNVIHILDSAGFTKLNSCTEIQLTTLYLRPLETYKVVFCNVQPQFSGDCGLHAIANTVEYCFNQFIGITDVQFDREKMRAHCLLCFESGSFTPFPKKGRGRSKLSNRKVKSILLTSHCFCRMPDFLEDIIQCENSSCGKWFHFGCADYKPEESSGKSWFCKNCI